MSKRRIFITCLLFLAVLSAVRIAWYSALTPPAEMQATQGVLDLRQSGMPEDRAVMLGGDWAFYPGMLITEADPHSAQYLKVPGSWWSSMDRSDRDEDSYWYGTYRLRILLPEDEPRLFSLRVSRITGAAKLYMNGELLHQVGRPASTPDAFEFGDVPYMVTFPSDQQEIELLVQVASNERGSGGITRAIYLGTPSAIDRFDWFSITMQYMNIVIFAIHFIYACILYALGVRQSSLVYFAIFILFAALTIMIDDDRLLFTWISFDYKWTRYLQVVAYLGTAILMLEFVKRLLPDSKHSRLLHLTRAAGILYAIFLLFVPADQIRAYTIITISLTLIPFLTLPSLALRYVRQGNRDGMFLLLGVLAIDSNVIWGSLKSRVLFITGYYPIDTLIATLLFAVFWFRHYILISNEAQQLSTELQAADRAKDEFLANTSHELRNPLHGILSIAQSVLNRGGESLDETNRKNISLLIAVGRRMSLMLNDLIELTRLKDNAVRLNTRSLQLSTVTRGVIDMLIYMTQNKPITFRNEISEDFPKVTADENRLIQILFNLLHNAVKYTNEGTISIRAHARQNRVWISVTDTGIGIENQVLQQIFKPYEQIDAASTNAGGGNGLGLSICKQLVELHGGEITVASKVGEGSTFRFSLPLAPVEQQDEPAYAGEAASAQGEASFAEPSAAMSEEAAATAEDAATMEAAPSALTATALSPSAAGTDAASEQTGPTRPRILAVDDDSLNLIVLQNILPAKSYEIVTAPSGKEALSLLAAGEYDLVISDVMMPYMSGYELTRIIREQYSLSELPILLLTARNRPEDIESGFRAGANDYVTKPVDGIELQMRVQALTELNRSVREQLNLEAAWLQAQIQPHFLFNTLNAISALSSIDIQQMRELLEQFSTYLRTSFNFLNLERLVPLSHELELVQAYVFIEQARFEDRLQVILEVGDSHAQLMIPPLTIQPLVENAIRHGVLKRTAGGVIRIRIEVQDERAIITVADNGDGMDEQLQRKLFTKHSDNGSGVGLYNTDRRLRQIYGSGLQVDSKSELGTTISFVVPCPPAE